MDASRAMRRYVLSSRIVTRFERFKHKSISWIDDDNFEKLTFSIFFQKILEITNNFNSRYLRTNVETIPVIIVFVISYVFSCLLSVIYRWSLKSTSIIWSPLIWVIVRTQTIGSVRFRLHNICNTVLYKAMRWYSAIVLVLFGIKLLVWLGPQTVALNTNMKPLLEPFIEPARLPLWQIFSAISAVLAIALYFLADWHLKQIEVGQPNRSPEQTIKRKIGAITFCRNIFALYTITCTIYIAWKISAQIEWPVFEFILFPSA